MKKTILIALFYAIILTAFGQKLPILDLRDKRNSEIEFPENLEVNEIGIIIKLTGGWSAYDNISYYIFKNNGNVIAYSEQTPKSYLRKTKGLKDTLTQFKLYIEQKKKFIELLNSNKTIDFIKYSQKDFKNSDLNLPPPCPITDAIGYQFTFVQNGKENSYKYYAPEYILKRCDDKNVNKTVLGKFVELINLWAKPK